MVIHYYFCNGMKKEKWESYFSYHKELINEFLSWILPQDEVIWEIDVGNTLYNKIIEGYAKQKELDKKNRV